MFDRDHDHQATPFDMIQWTAAMNNPPSYTQLLEAPDNLCAFDAGFESSSAAAALVNNNNYISDGINGNYYYQNVDHGTAPPLYPMYQNAWLYGGGSSSVQYFPGKIYHGPTMFEYSGGSQEDHKVFENPSHLGFFGKPGFN